MNAKLAAFLSLFLAALALGESPGKVIVANFGAGTITVIDARTDAASSFALPPAARPSEPMYVVYSRSSDRVFVGDRANNRVVVFRRNNLTPEREIAVGNGVFHMWESRRCRQLWVVTDVDNTLTVIDTISLTVVATVAMPADLAAAGGRPHDVFADPAAPFVYVSVIGVSGPADYVVRYSTTSFAEVGRQAVGKDPHLWVSPRNNRLYAPCQGSGQVYVLDRRTMTLMETVAVPGAHGAAMASSERTFYTTSFPVAAGGDGLFRLDGSPLRVSGVTPVPASTPHNIVVTRDGRKMYVTHSGSNDSVSVYALQPGSGPPQLLRTVFAGQNPFGLTYVPGNEEIEANP
jgi:DNA-binding beta-propeller fold protein YncE